MKPIEQERTRQFLDNHDAQERRERTKCTSVALTNSLTTWKTELEIIKLASSFRNDPNCLANTIRYVAGKVETLTQEADEAWSAFDRACEEAAMLQRTWECTKTSTIEY